MRILENKVILVILLFTILFPSFCKAHSKIKFKGKTLVQILDQYAEKGYVIIGPVEIIDITPDYLKPFNLHKIKKTKKLKIINKKGKYIKLHKGDKVYIIKKDKSTIIIKIPFKERKDE